MIVLFLATIPASGPANISSTGIYWDLADMRPCKILVFIGGHFWYEGP